MSEWTEELKQQVIDTYKESNPTPETSTEIVKVIADDIEMTVNGVRAILVRADVYVKKDPAKKSTDGKASSKRVSKADAVAALDEIIKNNELEVDESITSKLTGKAAVYFTDVIKALTVKEE